MEWTRISLTALVTFGIACGDRSKEGPRSSVEVPKPMGAVSKKGSAPANSTVEIAPVSPPANLSPADGPVVTEAVAAPAEVAAAGTRIYRNELKVLENPPPLLADFPQFVEPVKEKTRYEAPLLLDDEGADLSVRAWRFSYNARGIIEMPNQLKGSVTALIVVHPWGIDDGQGWRTPEPAGICDFCTPEKNHLSHTHLVEVVNPLLKRLRSKVGLVGYSLIGKRDPIRMKLYRSIWGTPTEEERRAAAEELKRTLNAFNYQGKPIPESIPVSKDRTLRDYFNAFRGTDASDHYNGAGFWDLPVPVVRAIDVDPNDLLIFDVDGYPALRDYLKKQGIRNILLTGYATDMCFCKTTAGYENLSQDFNVFLVGDATLATFPANETPRFATNAHISYAALNQLVTQCSWIKPLEPSTRP